MTKKRRRKKDESKRGDDTLKRQKVRRAYRDERDKVLANKGELTKPGTEGLSKRMAYQAALQDQVSKPREGGLDAEVFRTTVGLHQEKATKVETKIGALTPALINSGLLEAQSRSGNGKDIDYAALGAQFASFLALARTPSLVYGPAGTAIEPRKARKRISNLRNTKALQNKNAAKPKSLGAEEETDLATREDTAHIHGILGAIKTTGRIPLYLVVINPHSFGQTVENLFYTSFLIKRGLISMTVDPDTSVPWVQATDIQSSSSAKDDLEANSRMQAILAIDHARWTDLIDAFGITEPLLPEIQA